MADTSKLETRIERLEARLERLERKASRRFCKPTYDDVSGYAESVGYRGFDSTAFCDHYEANGWQVGRTPMRDWKAAVRNWQKNNAIFANGSKNNKEPSTSKRLTTNDIIRQCEMNRTFQ